MNERRSAGSGVVGYAIVLVGVAGFVLSCFLPYSSFGPANGLSRSTTSYYEVITLGGRTRLQYVGGGRAPVPVRRCRDRRMGCVHRTPPWPA